MSLIPFANRRIVWCSSLQASQHSSIPHCEIPLRFRERAGAVPLTGRPCSQKRRGITRWGIDKCCEAWREEHHTIRRFANGIKLMLMERRQY